VLDPDEASPAGLVSHHHIRTPYLDAAGLAQLAQASAAITTEFENVPAQALAELAKSRPVAPGAAAVSIAQDRALEKAHFIRCGVACAPHAVIETEEQLRAVDSDLLPGILKTSRLGYDGKGQRVVASREELVGAWDECKRVPCVLEKKLALDFECSAIVARSRAGQVVNLPLQRNLHRGGILAVTEVHEQAVPAAIAQQAIAAARAIAQGMDYVGVLCVEFFVLQGGALVVNEMAPRPHNSGHYTIDACVTSQFAQQVRAMAKLPLGDVRQHSPAVMLNILGDVWFDGETVREPAWDQVLALPGANLHLYGKTDPRRGRKMGHVTFVAPTLSEAQASFDQACAILGIPL
jgi:5-(carboxyamino)imidazole ribonucleotide synthase